MRPSCRPRATPLTAVVAAVVAAVLALLLVPLTAILLGRPDDHPDAEHEPPPGAVLDGPDRRALAPVRVRRGAAAPPVDPTVDLAEPEAVARAYATAARTVRPDDDGRTHLAAAGYAVPGSPPAAVGVLVLDPPPPGQVRTAAVTALALVHSDAADLRRGYRASVATATGPPGGAPASRRAVTTVTTTYLVLVRQPDGHWLVAADTPDVPEGDD